MLRYRDQGPNPPTGIIQDGPRINVVFTLHPADAAPLLAAGETPPSATASLMIDTGAQSSLVDDSIPQSLGVSPIRTRSIMFGDGKPQDRPVYRLSMLIEMLDDRGRPTPAQAIVDVVGMNAKKQGHEGLMGRDLLRHFVLRYDGPNGGFELISMADQTPHQQATRAQGRHDKKNARKHRGK